MRCFAIRDSRGEVCRVLAVSWRGALKKGHASGHAPTRDTRWHVLEIRQYGPPLVKGSALVRRYRPLSGFKGPTGLVTSPLQLSITKVILESPFGLSMPCCQRGLPLSLTLSFSCWVQMT